LNSLLDKQKRLDIYLKKIEDLPSMPAVVAELIKLVDNPMTSTGQIEDLFSKDQGLTVKALKLANSAYYAIPGGAKTLNRAITFLGLNTIKQLLITASIFEAFKKLDSPPDFRLSEFWQHSMGAAIVAERLAKKLKFFSPEELFICGLTHDIGKLALLIIDKTEFVATCIYANQNKISFNKAELDRETPLHTFCGEVLAKKWKLPELVRLTIKEHHSPNPKIRSNPDPEINRAIDLVYLSNQIVHILNFGNSGYGQVPEINTEVVMRLGLSLDEMPKWLAELVISLEHAESMIRDLVSPDA
jgi:HD-like signal output (HDOD) protein